MKRTSYTHVVRNGKPVVVREPRGSVDDAATIRENVLLGAVLRRLSR